MDGTWLEWQEWQSCSVTCGGGTQERTRGCQQPLHGGLDCPGDSLEIRSCGELDCPGIIPNFLGLSLLHQVSKGYIQFLELCKLFMSFCGIIMYASKYPGDVRFVSSMLFTQ